MVPGWHERGNFALLEQSQRVPRRLASNRNASTQTRVELSCPARNPGLPYAYGVGHEKHHLRVDGARPCRRRWTDCSQCADGHFRSTGRDRDYPTAGADGPDHRDRAHGTARRAADRTQAGRHHHAANRGEPTRRCSATALRCRAAGAGGDKNLCAANFAPPLYDAVAPAPTVDDTYVNAVPPAGAAFRSIAMSTSPIASW